MHTVAGGTRLTERSRGRVLLRVVLAVVITVLGMPVFLASGANAAPVGQGFNLNRSATCRSSSSRSRSPRRHGVNTNGRGPCGTLLGTGTNQIPDEPAGVDLP